MKLSDEIIWTSHQPRLFVEPRCHWSGTVVGLITAIAATVTIAGTIYGVVNMSSAQSAKSGDSSTAAPAVSQEISNLTGDVTALQSQVATENATIATQKNLEYIALAIGAIALGIILFRQPEKK